MKRLFVLILVSIALPTACGGDKQVSPTPTSVRSTSVTPTASATTDATPTAVASATVPAARSATGSEQAVGSIFNTLFSSGALNAATGSGAHAAGATDEGDLRLKQYVLKASEFPAGYGGVEEFSSRVPDGISTSGMIDVAASVATRGDITADDPKDISILASMVMKPQDLQALGNSLDSAKRLTDQDLQDAITGSAGSFGGLTISDAHVLDASGLGDGGFGISLSMDLGVLAPKWNMRIYIFARGDYLGGIVHVAFSDGLDAADGDLALARIIDSKLRAAP
ncbi:MAG: hypothetical protein M3P30_13490 [Chloroflexota bacterium]|nr:hypothetical protein [Chloroflexota bacterium]